MAGTIRNFDCVLSGAALKKPAKGTLNLPSPAISIVVRRWSSGPAGRVEISPDLMAEREIDYQIKMLKEDLDYVGKKAKRLLTAARKRKASAREASKS